MLRAEETVMNHTGWFTTPLGPIFPAEAAMQSSYSPTYERPEHGNLVGEPNPKA